MFKFEEVAPTAKEAEDKVANFLTLSVADISFKLEHYSLQEGSSTTYLMATGKDRSFPYNFLYFEDHELIGILCYIQDPKLLALDLDSPYMI